MTKWGRIVGTAALLLVLAGCGPKKNAADTPTHVDLQTADVITTMDPAMAVDVVSGQALANCYSGLYRYIGNRLTPDMAKEMATVSGDGLTYTFHLRQNVKWSNGDPVTAGDFVYAWRRAVAPSTGSQYAYVFSAIKNGDDIINGRMAPNKLGVRAQDKHTLVVTLSRPTAHFDQLLTLQTFLPMDQKAVDKETGYYGQKSKGLVYNGPYKLQKWASSDQEWLQVKNPQYWNEHRVKIDELHYKVVRTRKEARQLYEDQELDDAVVDPREPGLDKNPGYNMVTENRTFYLEMNGDRVPALNQVAVRQALSLVVDQRAFIKDALHDGSQPLMTVVPNGMIFDRQGKDFTEAPTKELRSTMAYNLPLAQKRFAEGLAAIHQDHVTITLTADADSLSNHGLEVLKKMLEAVSTPNAQLTIKTRRVDYADRLRMTSAKQNDMVLTGWTADYPDAATVLELFRTGGVYNGGNWHNAEYDALLDRAQKTDARDPVQRRDDLQKASVLLTQEAGVIPLFQRGRIHLTRPDIHGMSMTPIGMVNFIGATRE